ncbi:MAG: DNA-binding protein [Chloroflexi bacterium]|nr:DNA-binding protein [Chloroflexota bacterium]
MLSRRDRAFAAIYNSVGSAVSDETGKRDPLEDLTKKLISVTEASQISGLTVSYIRRMIRAKQVWGVKIGRSWLTTREAIQEYMKQDRRRGPKPRSE